MNSRLWWISVSPLTGEHAKELTDEIARRAREGVNVLLVDEQEWFCRAMSPDAVRALASLLRIALISGDAGADESLVGRGVLDDMETWLDDEYGSS